MMDHSDELISHLNVEIDHQKDVELVLRQPIVIDLREVPELEKIFNTIEEIKNTKTIDLERFVNTVLLKVDRSDHLGLVATCLDSVDNDDLDNEVIKDQMNAAIEIAQVIQSALGRLNVIMKETPYEIALFRGSLIILDRIDLKT